MSKKISALFVAACFVFLLGGVGAAWAKLRVAVSILPQKYFVGQIAGPEAEIMVMVMPGASPATYEPKPRQMAELSRTKAYFALGAPFEKTWLKRFEATAPRMLMVHTEKDVPRVAMESSRGEKQGQSRKRASLDPHIWLAPKLVAIQAKAIRDGLIRIDPANKKTYEANFQSFKAGCLELDAGFRKDFSGLGSHNRILVFHPAWGYFCRSYGLEQIAIEKEGKRPGPKALAAVISQAKRLGIKVIFASPQISLASSKIVAKAIGGQVVILDPLAEDWAANLRLAADTIRKTIR